MVKRKAENKKKETKYKRRTKEGKEKNQIRLLKLQSKKAIGLLRTKKSKDPIVWMS